MNKAVITIILKEDGTYETTMTRLLEAGEIRQVYKALENAHKIKRREYLRNQKLTPGKEVEDARESEPKTVEPEPEPVRSESTNRHPAARAGVIATAKAGQRQAG